MLCVSTPLPFIPVPQSRGREVLSGERGQQRLQAWPQLNLGGFMALRRGGITSPFPPEWGKSNERQRLHLQ